MLPCVLGLEHRQHRPRGHTFDEPLGEVLMVERAPLRGNPRDEAGRLALHPREQGVLGGEEPAHQGEGDLPCFRWSRVEHALSPFLAFGARLGLQMRPMDHHFDSNPLRQAFIDGWRSSLDQHLVETPAHWWRAPLLR
jgi:hypothetical protein